jgi:NADPH:quinone reductase-like Zn-dependent oxidoreductase
MARIRRIRIHRFGGPEVLQLDSIEPSLPDAGQVMVSVHAASVNPVDFKIRSGKYPAVKDDRLPYAIGRDASGVVESAAPRRRGSSPATRCSGWSAFAVAAIPRK